MHQLLVPVPIGSSGQSEVNVIQPWIGCGSVAGVIGRFPGRTGVHGAPVVVEMSGAPQAFHFCYVLFVSWLRLQFRLFPKLLLRLFRESYAGYDCDVFIKHRRGRMEAFILDVCQTYALDFMPYSIFFDTLHINRPYHWCLEDFCSPRHCSSPACGSSGEFRVPCPHQPAGQKEGQYYSSISEYLTRSPLSLVLIRFGGHVSVFVEFLDATFSRLVSSRNPVIW